MATKKQIYFAIVTVLIWSTGPAVIKLLVNGIPNYEVIYVTSGMATVFLLLLNCVTGTIKELKGMTAVTFIRLCGLGMLGMGIYTFAYYYGIKMLKAQDASILNYLWPIFIVIFSAIILKEKISIKAVIAIIMSFFGGIVVITNGQFQLSSINSLSGALCCVLASACYGLFCVLNKKETTSQMVCMMIYFGVTTVAGFIVSFLTEDMVAVEGTQYIGLMWVGVVVNGIAYLTWALALKNGKGVAVSNMAYMTPALATIVSAVLLKEKIEVASIVGLAIILAGVFLQQLGSKEKN